MDILANPVVLALLAALGGVLGAWGLRALDRLNNTSDQTNANAAENHAQAAMLQVLERLVGKLDERGDAHADKTAATREELVAVKVRVTSLEEDRAKMADALQRLVVLEERAEHTQRAHEQSEATNRVVIALTEQMKSAFKRIDQLTDTLQALVDSNRESARNTARELFYLLRPDASRAA